MIVAPLRFKSALQILPAAMLFAGLVLGGPSFTEDPSTRLESMNQYCTPRGCVNTGDTTGDTIGTGGRSVEQGVVKSIPVLIVAED